MGADVFGFDVYPVPSEPLETSGEFVRLATEHVPRSERIAVLEAFSYDAQSGRTDMRRGPTAEESRFMAYDALVSGATILSWYGASALDLERDADAAVWSGVTSIVRELRSLSTVLSAARVPVEVTGDAAAMGFELDGGLFVVVVGRSDEVVETEIRVGDGFRGAIDHISMEPSTVTEGLLELTLPAHGVRLMVFHRCDQ